ncbi:Multidrug resistance protein 1, partial [Trichoplax sp. H2]
MAACIAGFTMGFVRGWKLTLVIIAISPLLAIVAAFMSKFGSAFTNKELEAYSKAGGVAEEILSSVRTVVSFGGEKKACERYDGQLDHALRVGIKKAFVTGTGIALTFLVMFGSYALAFWYGSTLIAAGEMSGGTILTVFFSVMIGAMSLGHAAPCVENFANAKGAGAVVFEIIDTIPPIDASSDEGEKPSNVTGDIQLRNINFTYPARKDVQVLKNFNLNIKHGQTLALVGGSGCGKSTVVQLIQRFYDPQDGCVEIDGRNIKTLNVSWLRQNIGIVSQEPCLFATTIKENIRNGNESASDEDITKAAQNANAYDFIKALPKGFDTMVGERGAQLSGGQKQRIAIARALVKNPKILLLDEATSALDNESEAIVQAALDKAREGRTTIVIAHRLSTVRNANVLAALQDGAVAELGTHDELMDVKGIYYELVTNQTFGKSDDNEDEEEIAQIDEIADLKNASFRAGSPKVLDNSKRGRQSSVSKQLSRQFSSKSASSDVQKEEEEEKEDLPPVSFLKIMRLNKDELGYIFIGTLGAIGQGSVMPVFAILFSEIIAVFAECDPVKRESDATFWSLMFLVLGSVSGISVFLQTLMYGISGEYMTKRLRSQTFRAILKQEIGWFDEQSHTTGALCNRLATDASEVKGATGTRLG